MKGGGEGNYKSEGGDCKCTGMKREKNIGREYEEK